LALEVQKKFKRRAKVRVLLLFQIYHLKWKKQENKLDAGCLIPEAATSQE